MADMIIQFFGLMGLSPEVPSTFPELIQWMFFLVVGLILVALALRVVSVLVRALFDFRRY